MRILLFGKGISNNALHQFLIRYKIDHDFCDLNEKVNFDYDLVVKGPGLSYDNEVIKNFMARKVSIVDDIELVYRLLNRDYIAVTGTNGKTTTVRLIEALLNQKYHAISCGNIGYPIAQAAIDYKDYDYFVLELSSFELLGTVRFTPKIAVILNLCEAHLDYHKTVSNYHLAKMKIAFNQTPDEFLIYNADDVAINTYLAQCKATKYSFSLCNTETNAYFKGCKLYYNNKYVLKIKRVYRKNKGLKYDLLASFIVAMLLGISKKKIKYVFKTFKESKYRLNYIKKGIYNDAKSTNIYSTIMGLEYLKKKTYLICGGAYRLMDLSLLLKVKDKIKAIFAYGETKKEIETFCLKNDIQIEVFETLEEALKKVLLIRKSEYILYSPMYPSYDQFNSFYERGALFNKLVKKLVK